MVRAVIIVQLTCLTEYINFMNTRFVRYLLFTKREKTQLATILKKIFKDSFEGGMPDYACVRACVWRKSTLKFATDRSIVNGGMGKGNWYLGGGRGSSSMVSMGERAVVVRIGAGDQTQMGRQAHHFWLAHHLYPSFQCCNCNKESHFKPLNLDPDMTFSPFSLISDSQSRLVYLV